MPERIGDRVDDGWRAAMAPASPQPLIPSGFEGQGVTVIPIWNDGRSTARGMQ